MSNLTSLQGKMKSLSRPYKRSAAYKKYGEVKAEKPKSTFWDPKVKFVQKYETEKI